ncbi:MAG: hypothetical protein V3S14_10445 [Anaerolineae bacterium]
MNNTVVGKVVEQLETFPENLQQQVLAFVEALRTAVRPGIPGKQLLRFVGAISLDDLQLVQQAIETGCGQVDLNGW